MRPHSMMARGRERESDRGEGGRRGRGRREDDRVRIGPTHAGRVLHDVS